MSLGLGRALRVKVDSICIVGLHEQETGDTGSFEFLSFCLLKLNVQSSALNPQGKTCFQETEQFLFSLK